MSAAVMPKPDGAHGRLRQLVSAGGAFLIYGGVATWAWLAPAPSPIQAAAPPPPMQVELFAPPPAPPPVPPPPPPPRAKITTPRAAAPAEAPAQAAEVVAQEAAPGALDLTAFTVVAGRADKYAGGNTASQGASAEAVDGPAVAGGQPGGTGTAARGDLSRLARLANDEWDCPWPAEADALGVNEQTVLLRVNVRADGSVQAVIVVKDPGYGFGPEALACAREARFEAALDLNGQPTQSHRLLRVAFTR